MVVDTVNIIVVRLRLCLWRELVHKFDKIKKRVGRFNAGFLQANKSKYPITRLTPDVLLAPKRLQL
jgi:hypothetical protein